MTCSRTNTDGATAFPHHVHLFLDRNLLYCPSLSFHPNDCRATVVIARTEFERYLARVGNSYEYLDLYEE